MFFLLFIVGPWPLNLVGFFFFYKFLLNTSKGKFINFFQELPDVEGLCSATPTKYWHKNKRRDLYLVGLHQ